MVRECGNRPSSRPLRNTSGNSRPLAACRLISVICARCVVVVGVGDEGGVVEKLVERFGAVAGIHGGVDQFAQVLDAGESFGRVFCFEQLDVAGAVDEEFQEVGGAHCGSRETMCVAPICSSGWPCRPLASGCWSASGFNFEYLARRSRRRSWRIRWDRRRWRLRWWNRRLHRRIAGLRPAGQPRAAVPTWAVVVPKHSMTPVRLPPALILAVAP